MDFSISEIVEEVCDKYKIDPLEALTALLGAVVDEHRMMRHEDVRGEPRQETMLEALGTCIHDQSVRNVEIHEQYTREDEPDDRLYVMGMMRCATANRQEIVLEIVRVHPAGRHPRSERRSPSRGSRSGTAMASTASFEVSQDGGVMLVWNEKGEVRCRRDIRTTNANKVLP